MLEAALDVVLDQQAKRRHLVKNPRKAPPPRAPDSGHIPADVARAVWLRDGGRCQYPTADGGICGSTYQCELDHVEPKALGGKATKETLRVACRPHDLRYAREVFGDEVMDRYCANPRAPRPPRVRETEAEYGTSTATPTATAIAFGVRRRGPTARRRIVGAPGVPRSGAACSAG